MTDKDIIELIERNPSIGRQTAPGDLQLLNEYNIKLFNKPIVNLGCASCVLKGLDRLRGYVGYNPLSITVDRSITKKRLDICSACEYRVVDGFNPLIGSTKDTCGNFLNKTRSEPDKTSEGVELCGCILSSKAKLNNKWLIKLGGCPANKWDI